MHNLIHIFKYRDLEGAKGVAASLRENHKLLLLEPLVKQALTAVDMAVAAQDCGDQVLSNILFFTSG